MKSKFTTLSQADGKIKLDTKEKLTAVPALDEKLTKTKIKSQKPSEK
jgi:hypothetical protein